MYFVRPDSRETTPLRKHTDHIKFEQVLKFWEENRRQIILKVNGMCKIKSSDNILLGNSETVSVVGYEMYIWGKLSEEKI